MPYTTKLQREYDEGREFTVSDMFIAVHLGGVDELRFIYEHGGPRSAENICSNACEVDSLPCLQFLHEHGFHWDKYTMVSAYQAGSLECLQYAVENGCPWDNSIKSLSSPNKACEEYVARLLLDR